jgi:phosphatidate cytidylyltransferase
VGIPANATAAHGAARSGLKQRVLTAIVLVPLLLASLFLLPGTGWQLLTSLPIAVAAGEWARLAGYQKFSRIAFIGIVLASCVAFVVALSSTGFSAGAGGLSSLLLVVALMLLKRWR